MKICITKERAPNEPRVAATAETVKKLISGGHSVSVEKGAGLKAGIRDSDYEEAGAWLFEGLDSIAGTELLLKVSAPSDEEIAALPDKAAIIGLLDPFTANLSRYAKKSITAFAMEKTPRITRAQSMDALSSQSNLAGYRAVIEGSQLYTRSMAMMMTAAGTVAPAKVFVMGAGVAGLQAIATARRLGAVVTATDVRPAAKEQVASLGAKFIAVEDDEFKAAETVGGYAKEMSDEYKAKQAALTEEHIAKQDIVITTALIPGRPAPELVSEAMVKSMRAGSVIIDLAAPMGGNCALTKADEIVDVDGVLVAGWSNLPGRMAADTSALYAKNLLNFLPLVTGEDGSYTPDFEDEIVTAMAIVKDGAVVEA